ncbi:hypothetical protein XELAEV_18022407mg [Xenopus laevis]|uniref:Uncharacterized protein n=1 Tax=Xenopus laevis TaxID=8355 RepID=A0A974HN63_XENLA|nr:hypothetical protein XELAEV_18022407mg [Xenopus laevis]
MGSFSDIDRTSVFFCKKPSPLTFYLFSCMLVLNEWLCCRSVGYTFLIINAVRLSHCGRLKFGFIITHPG